MSVKGQALPLFSSAARTTAGANQAGSTYYPGFFSKLTVILNLTAAATDAGDTLDVFVDCSQDGSIWYNSIHFTQCIGTGGAKKYFAVLDTTSPGTSVLDVASDCAAGVTRPQATGPYVRGRYTLVDSGTVNASFTFSLTATAEKL